MAAAQESEAGQARLVVRRTRAGLLAAVVLAAAAGWFGIDASDQKDRAVAAATEATEQTARAQAYVAQIHNDKGRYFEAAQAALAGLTNPLTLETDPAQTAPWNELVRATVADGFLVPPLQHDGLVTAATFDATGERVVTASLDKTARIWDARTGEPLGKKLQHDGQVWAATFDATGGRVVTVSDDNTARIWDAAPAVGQALLDHVRATLGRNAPDALKVPDQTQSFVNVIGRGFSTLWTRLTAALP